MRRNKTYRMFNSVKALSVFLYLLLAASCDVEGDLAVCSYNTRLVYRYDRENTSKVNVLPQYIGSLSEYIFDEQGLLYTQNTLPGSSCYGRYVSEMQLPPGNYCVITWGNIGNRSQVGGIQPGIITREDFFMFLNSPNITSQDDDRVQNNSERLFYGYRTFCVGQTGVSRVQVDMMHSHCVMNISVKWKSAAPGNTGDFYMLLKDVPSQYDFMPEFVFDHMSASLYGLKADVFPASSNDVLRYIPVVLGSTNLTTHRLDVKMNAGKELGGEFVTYRYRNDSHPLLSIYAGNNRVMKEIDLHDFFKTMNIELDKNLRQEFTIGIEINGDTIAIGLISIGDWNEGGALG